MPVTDVRVALRVASSDHLRPRALQASAVAVEATALDQIGEPIPGAIADLSVITPAGVELRFQNVTADGAGRATRSIALADAGDFIARSVVTSPQSEVSERGFIMKPGAVQPPPGPVTVLADPDGVVLILPSGFAIEGTI